MRMELHFGKQAAARKQNSSMLTEWVPYVYIETYTVGHGRAWFKGRVEHDFEMTSMPAWTTECITDNGCKWFNKKHHISLIILLSPQPWKLFPWRSNLFSQYPHQGHAIPSHRSISEARAVES